MKRSGEGRRMAACLLKVLSWEEVKGSGVGVVDASSSLDLRAEGAGTRAAINPRSLYLRESGWIRIHTSAPEEGSARTSMARGMSESRIDASAEGSE